VTQTYEINLWDNKKVIRKVVQQFENDEGVIEYIKKEFDTQPDPQYPQMDPERGYLRPKADKYIITWAKITTYVRKKGPKRIQLTDKELELQETLEKSITHKTIDEWGRQEMLRMVRKDYLSNPNAKGLKDIR
jgi:hypothetical protein